MQTPPKALTAQPKKVAAAERPVEIYVSPKTGGRMRGGTWIIEDFNQDTTYRIPLQTERVTTVLLRDGETVPASGIIGGNPEGIGVTNTYVGSRPAINIMPSWSGVSGTCTSRPLAAFIRSTPTLRATTSTWSTSSRRRITSP